MIVVRVSRIVWPVYVHHDGVPDVVHGEVQQGSHMRVIELVVGLSSGPLDFDDAMGAKKVQRMRHGRLTEPGNPGEISDPKAADQQGAQDPNASGVAEEREHVGDVGDSSIVGHAVAHSCHLVVCPRRSRVLRVHVSY
jgi:hypothetical protein